MALILVVDDEPDIRFLACMTLTRAGHDVVECADGAEALARLADEPRPDAVVLDLRMPGLSGWEVLDRLPAGAPPVLLVTADPTAAEGRHPTLLTKPYRPAELLSAVEAVLGAGDPGASP